MDADAVNDFILNPFIAFHDTAQPVIWTTRDDENLVPSLHKTPRDVGNREMLGIVKLADDEDFHVNYYRTKLPKVQRAHV